MLRKDHLIPPEAPTTLRRYSTFTIGPGNSWTSSVEAVDMEHAVRLLVPGTESTEWEIVDGKPEGDYLQLVKGNTEYRVYFL